LEVVAATIEISVPVELVISTLVAVWLTPRLVVPSIVIFPAPTIDVPFKVLTLEG
jgi:hypothetical protein